MVPSRKSALAATLILLFSGFGLHGQQLSTFYYNGLWEDCKRSEASFYREVQLDKAGKPIGLVYDYYINGKLQFCGKMLSLHPMVFDSLCTWYDDDGYVEIRAEYAKGKRNGVQRRYYSTGQVASEMTFRNDTPVSDYTLFFGNGKLDGVRHYLVLGDTVPFEEYFIGGELKGKGFYKRGANIPWDDTLISSIEYQDTGHLDYDITENPHLKGPGKHVAYRTGKLVVEQHFLNGVVNGWQVWYDKNGQPTLRAFYRNGKIDSLKEQFVGGQLTQHEEYTNFEPSGTWLNYYTDGKVAAKHIYHHDTVETLRYYNDGHLQLHDFTWHGGQIKRREDYYPNGDIQEIKVYSPQVEHLGGVLIDSTFYTGHRLKYVAKLFENAKYGKDDAFSNMAFDSLGRITNYKPPVNERIYPVKDNLACLYGFKNYDGTWAIRPKYTLADAHGSYFLVWEGNHCGLISITGDSVLPCAYTRIEIVTFSKADNPVAILLEKGRLKLSEAYHYDRTDLSKTDFYFVTLDTLHGVLTSHGDTLLPIVYNAISHNLRDSTISCKKGETQSIIKLPQYKRVEFAGMLIAETGINDLYYFTHKNEWPGAGAWYPHPGTGLINASGRVILADTFNYVQLGFIKQGVIGFGTDGFGLMDTGGRVLLEPLYRPSVPPSAFETYYHYGLLPLVDRNLTGLYDLTGKQLLPFRYKDITMLSYNSNLKITDEHGKMGAYSVAGKSFILPCQFDNIEAYNVNANQKHSYVYLCRKNGLYGIYDDKGKLTGGLWPFCAVLDPSSATFLFTDGSVIVRVSATGNTSSFYQGSMLPGGAQISDFYTSTGDKIKCIYNANNNVIYMGKALDVKPMPDGKIFVKDTLGKVKLIDILGTKVVDLSAWPNLTGPVARSRMITGTRTGKYGLINEAGNLIIDTAYSNIWIGPDEDQNMAPVFWARDINAPLDTTTITTDDGEQVTDNFEPLMNGWKALDFNGHVIIKGPCVLPAPFKNNVAIVETANGVGAFDDKGNTIFKDTFTAIEPLTADLFLMLKDRLYGIIHKNGEWLTPVQWQKINFVTDDYLVVSDSNKLIVLNYKGDTLVPPDFNAFLFSDSDYTERFGAGNINGNGEDEARHVTEGLDDENKAQYPLLDKVIKNYLWYNYLASVSLEATEPQIIGGIMYGQRTAPMWDPIMPPVTESDENLIDFTPHTFSMETVNSYCAHGSGCSYSRNYHTFMVQKRAIVSLTIDSVLNTEGKNASAINELLKEQIAVDEDLHIDCQNAEGFFETYKDNFSIGKTGITFYPVEDEHTFGPPDTAPAVTVPYAKLGRYLRAGIAKLIYERK